jgi:CheY-like chemotaxis protein
MDAGTQARIFEPFFTTKFTGRGLGLAAVLGILRGHNGAVKVSSEPGHGTAVKVLFPAARESVPTSPEPAPAPTLDWSAGTTVLVVEDDEFVRDIARRTLENAGLTVLDASDGERGIALFEREHRRISVVLLDLMMPGLSGEEVLAKLRERRADLPVILSSGYNEQVLSRQAVEDGEASFIQKPYRPVELLQRISRSLEHAQRPQ